MSVDPTTGAIFVSKNKPEGTYEVKITGMLHDYVTTTSVVHFITILPPINYPPLFSTSLSNVTVPLMGL